MSKVRVYELAKELGIENKELIARLEKIGIAVKSHASSLEESDVERVKREFTLGEPGEIVEQRIKTTVIRRRAVRHPMEEETPTEVEEKEEPAGSPGLQAVQIEKEIYVGEEEQKLAEKLPEAPEEKITVVEKEKIEEAPSPEISSQKADTIEVKAPPKEISTPLSPEPAAKAIKKISTDKMEGKVVKEVVPPKEEKPTKPVVVKPLKKGKRPVEVLMEETPAKKKAFVKQVVDKKDKRWIREVDEDRPLRWREEKREAVVRMKKTEITTPKAIKRRIKVEEAIRIADLAKRMGVKASEVMSKLIALGVMASINQAIDTDTAGIVAAEFGYQVESVGSDFEETTERVEADAGHLLSRAPVVTVMGHVDHGKTSLLDAIRETNVIEGEAGGITQAIGAYHVRINERDIVFLDTPGHEAFTSMRARGAQVTDIVVLVVAADDGVKEQTVEAINHARAAKVPIIVAVNKIDKPEAHPEKIKRELADYRLVSEEWGGDTLFTEISAKKKIGIENLLELILLQADIMELKADPHKAARGVIIEAKLDRGRGPVATVLIQEGTLHEGDSFVCKTEFGRVRALINDKGQRIKEGGPSMPLEVIGFSNVPQAGMDFVGMEDEKKARSISEYWIRKEREKELAQSSKITLDQLYERIKEGAKELNVIIKGDVHGSIEALAEALGKLSTADVKLRVIHSSTGAITESDVLLASASDAIVVGFKVRPDSRVMETAKEEGVEIKLYDIIYHVITDVRAAMEGLLEPVYKDVVLGHAEVRNLFKVPKIGVVAGCYVTDGKILRNASVKLVRDGVQVYDGKILSLKRFKEDAREVSSGLECGIGIEGFNDLKNGDVIEAYAQEQIERKL
jgi:translation initiation factor IF-2